MGINRVILRAFIPAFFNAGFSANQTLRIAIDLGIGVRRQTFLRDWAELTGVTRLKDTAKYIPKKFFPPQKYIIPTELRLSGRYQYKFTVEVVDRLTGKTTKEHVSLISDDLLRVGTAEERMASRLEERPERYETEKRTWKNVQFTHVLLRQE